MLKAYKVEFYYHDDVKDILIHSDKSIENDLLITNNELEEYRKFDNFDDFFEFFKKNRGLMNVDAGMSCVRLDIFGTVRHVTKANFKPCSIQVKFEEIDLRFKDLMDMDADKAIQYIKERWNNYES